MQIGNKVAWFGGKQKASFGKVRLKHRELFFGKAEEKASMETVEKAYQAVQSTIGWLRHTEAKKLRDAMNLYFKSAVSEVPRVQSVLELVQGGMTGGKLSFKTDNTSASRSINYFGDAPDEVDLTEGYVRNRGDGTKGDIHVTRDYIMNNRFQAVRVFIHEATHRFANTDDFDEQGYMFADGSDFREPGITAAQCLNNADSYAYFCMAMGYR
jgi:hypothetical protein